MVERVSETNTTKYLHRDHQGSVTQVTSSGGSVTESLAYDAWGLRRNAADWSPLSSPFSGSHETARGYTGHEHLDRVGLIHMNGRVQDPKLGKFVSADPYIQAPYHTQSHNRLAYVMNNPATLTDPSGFQWRDSVLSPGVYYQGHEAHAAAMNMDWKAVPITETHALVNMNDLDGEPFGHHTVVVGWEFVPDERSQQRLAEQEQADLFRIQAAYGIIRPRPWFNETSAGLGVATNVRLSVPRTGGLAIELYPRGWVPQGGSTSAIFVQDLTNRQTASTTRLRLQHSNSTNRRSLESTRDI
jgi:RHS repeat-associated protein